ncbi:MAG: hypothetical protein AABX98_01660 [Nanoarchaeota archaeon]
MDTLVLDTELVGRLHGYVQWGAEVHWNKQEHHAHKSDVMTLLKEKRALGFEANKVMLQELKQVIERKQIPAHGQKIRVYHDIKETVEALKPHFRNMHVELFVDDAAFAAQRLHENVMILADIVKRQAKLVGALTPITYDELLPQIMYLYEKEQEVEKAMAVHAGEMHAKSHHVLKHLNSNYFERMKELTNDKKFREDHHDLFVAGYLLDVSSRAVAHVHGITTNAAKDSEEAFLTNIAPFQ